METKKISSLNFLLIFFLSYSFFSIQILSQLMFKYYSKSASFIICLMFTLFPLLIYFVCKSINKNKEKKNIIISIISCLYLTLTTIVSIVYISNIIIIYYYQQTSLFILLSFLILPILYTLIKGEHNFFNLASILLIIYVFFKYSYLKNFSSIDTYVLYDFFKIDTSNIFMIILIALPLLFEPLILFNNSNIVFNKINIKGMVVFAIILSLIGIITILRQTWEFGNLLSTIRFPYLESAKNILAGKFFENIDFYYLLSLSVSLYLRLGYTIFSIKKSFELSKLFSFLILIIILIFVYFLYSSMEVSEFITDKILIFSSLLLLSILFLIPITRRSAVTNDK